MKHGTSSNKETNALRDLVGLLRRHLAWITLCPLVGGLIALGLVQVVTPSYVATSAAYVQVDVPPEEGLMGYSSAAQLAGNTTDGFLPVITSRSVAQGVVDQLGLEYSPEEVSAWISASRVTGSRTIEITVTAPTQDLAVQVADAVVAQSSDKVRTLEGESYPVNLVLLTSAELSHVTQTPPKSRSIAAGVVGGLLVGVGIAFTLSLLYPDTESSRRAPHGGRALGTGPVNAAPGAATPSGAREGSLREVEPQRGQRSGVQV